MSDLKEYTDLEVQSELDLFVLDDLDFEIQCTSHHCQQVWKRGDHAADYSILLSCGCVTMWCAERFNYYHAEANFIWCVDCNGHNLWVSKAEPIKRVS